MPLHAPRRPSLTILLARGADQRTGYGRDRGETEMMGFDDIDAAIITGIFLIGLLLVAVVWRLSAGASDRDTHDQRRFRRGD